MLADASLPDPFAYLRSGAGTQMPNPMMMSCAADRFRSGVGGGGPQVAACVSLPSNPTFLHQRNLQKIFSECLSFISLPNWRLC